MLKNDSQASGTGTDFLASQGEVVVHESPLGESKARKALKENSPRVAGRKKSRKICTDKLRTRTAFQRFINETPRSTFKKLIISMPALLQGLHTMSLFKSVPEGLNPRECEQTKLRKPPPVPYIPEKDKVQEEVTKLCQLQIKTSLEKDTTLNFSLWQENGNREAFLMHVTAVLDAMKKRGHFSNYDKTQKAYEEAAKAAESAEAGLALLEGASEKSSKHS
jgi:hypothetical protein